MSFLTSPIAGALLAGGVYYGFSNVIQKRLMPNVPLPKKSTEQHRGDLHALSVRLVETPTIIQAPPSAVTRIKPHPLSSEIKGKWNTEVEALFLGFQNVDKTVVEFGRSLMYGSSVDRTKGR